MALLSLTALVVLFLAGVIYTHVVYPLSLSPLSGIPGPKSFALTKWRLAWEESQRRRTSSIHKLHRKYGPVVRIGPNEVHFNSLSALRTIYGAGSGYERSSFYRLFDVYKTQNMFTFSSAHEHGRRRRLLANAYAKSNVIRGWVADLVGEKVDEYLHLVAQDGSRGNEIFTSLHYFSMDVITYFLYGRCGGTAAITGNAKHQALLNDILDPTRTRLAWLAVHFPRVTAWLYSRQRLMERLVRPLLPMQKPATYSGIRAHAWTAALDSKAAFDGGKADENVLITRLYNTSAYRSGEINDIEIAAEVADHFLAGIDTTSDTLTFLLWALSLPQNAKYQEMLTAEAKSLPEDSLDRYGNPLVEAADRLPFLDAVLKETLRLYAPLPASEPRVSNEDTTVDGFLIPAGTIISMSPYSLHRNEDVFPEPLKWDPERWLGPPDQVAEMKKWWWAFSSGGRMCTGLHLAMAEMALVPAIYRKFSTNIKADFEGTSPAITSRFEIFFDETLERVAVSRPILGQSAAKTDGSPGAYLLD